MTNFDPRTFICSEACNPTCDGSTCDFSGLKVCTVGPPLTLPNPGENEVDLVPTCACEDDCPPCHKRSDDCSKCELDWTAPQNCNPCAEDAEGFSGDVRCAGLGNGSPTYKFKSCPPNSECTRPGGVIDDRTDDSFNPHTFICSMDCGKDCDGSNMGLVLVSVLIV